MMPVIGVPKQTPSPPPGKRVGVRGRATAFAVRPSPGSPLRGARHPLPQCGRGVNWSAEACAAVFLGPDRLPPPAVFEIPGDGLLQPGVEALARLPAELLADPCRIHRIAPVMTGPIRDKGDQPLMRPIWRVWQHLVQQSADRRDDREIGALAVATDIVA